MKLQFIFVIVAIFISAVNANAQLSPTFKNVNYDDQYMGVEGFILGRTCYSLRATRLNLNCNPAFMAGEVENKLNFNLNLDNNVTEVSGYINELQDHESESIINRILDNPKPLVAYDLATSWWQYDWWAVAVTPARLAVASAVTNPAYPIVSSHVSFQREVSMRGGVFVAEDLNFKIGANLRYVQNNQFRDEFALLDVISGTRKINVVENNIVYFEPAMTYSWHSAWESHVSLVLTHLRLYESDRSVPDVARPEIGYSTSPEYLNKKLRTSIHYTARPDVTRIGDRFRFGGIYEFSDLLSFSFSLAGDEYGLGVTGRYDSVVLGLGTKSELFNLNGSDVGRVTTTLFQAGLTF
ncbi:MAG: hypothetical protein KDD38_00020 [Bdellovibrionales bacterium]|nr:hypothetical protein [Bdellovibrionales bacterium]